MIKTDVPNYFRGNPGAVIHTNKTEYTQYMAQKRMIVEKDSMKSEINTMKDEIDQLKMLVQKLINKE